MDRISIKELAKRQISGQLGILLILYLIIFATVSVTSYINPIIGLVFSIIMDFAIASIYIKMSDGIDPSINSLFDIFKNGRLCGNSILLYLLVSIFTFLWSLLFIIPGIIKAFSYAMAPYILIENEYYMSPIDAIKESERIMYGHKMELFVLCLSFIGWYILGTLTFGILYIYIEPYYNMSIVNFYNEIKDNN